MKGCERQELAQTLKLKSMKVMIYHKFKPVVKIFIAQKRFLKKQVTRDKKTSSEE